MPTVAAYLRVSSKAQDHATQRAAIEQLAGARGDQVGQWYSEKVSGRTLTRPELTRLRADAVAGRLTKVYVFRLDRLTRSGIRDTLQVVEELRAAGVEVVSVSDGFDLNGPAAEVVLAVMAWASRMELVARNERIAAARVRLESEGKPWGRPTRVTPDDLRTMKRLRAQGRSLREIAVATKTPLSTVGRALAPSRKALAHSARAAPAAARG